MSIMSSADEMSLPRLPEDSPGSSVSSALQEEYDELLQYAVVIPSYKPEDLPKTLSDLRGSFPGMDAEDSQGECEDSEENTTTVDEEESDVSTIPDETHPKRPNQSSTPLNMSPKVDYHTRDASKPYPPMKMGLGDEKLSTRLFPGTATAVSDRPDSPTSTISHVDEMFITESTIDQDMNKMEGLLDQWTFELKRNVLAELSQGKIRTMEYYRQQLRKDKERHAAEQTQLQNEMESLRELLHTYEQSIERKDQVISNLTRAMQQQRDKFEMLKTFCEWKIRHNDVKREAFASNLAAKHYHRGLSQKAWDAWHSVVETRWRSRVEKACQSKAQEVCMQLTNDYEGKIASLNEALESSRLEVSRLHAERDKYEETMKKAFMRGVCALNMEAMSMFHEAETESNGEEDAQLRQQLEAAAGMAAAAAAAGLQAGPGATTISQEAVYTSVPPGAPAPRVVTSQQAATRGQSSMSQARSQYGNKPVGKSKTISAKVTARTDSGRSSHGLGVPNVPMGLAPPMSSVLVERHQPVVKQTIGHATASKFPRGGSGQSGGIAHRKLAGQSGQINIATPNIQTVKVVE